MCGIAGFIAGAGRPEADETALRQMAAAIAHRGPDDDGYFQTVTRDGSRRVCLAHKRLSIIDVGGGHQPMQDETGDLCLVFNGEIYNFESLRTELSGMGFRFRTKSDTEVILRAYAAWGKHCVQHFRGMFAFAIWDKTRQELFLARDHYGKKPLFLLESEGLLLFGSEPGAILAFPGRHAEVDHSALLDFFNYRYVPGPATLFKGIRTLEPGCTAIWRDGILNKSRYYLPPDGMARSPEAFIGNPVATFLDKLDESVRLRMVSDVPFGAFLSGGLDSSAVVALMSRHSNLPINTFSVGFGHGERDELPHARVVAKAFRTNHHELNIRVRDITDNLADVVRYRGFPASEPADVPIYLMAKEAGRSVKMVLTGEGSDEVLAGYPKHAFERWSAWYQAMPGWFRHGLLDRFADKLPPQFARLRTAILSMGIENFDERMSRWFGAIGASERENLLALPASALVRKPALQVGQLDGNTALRRILFFDQTSWLPYNLLQRGDRLTMAASLEARMPFMDIELSALVSRLPDRYRLRSLQGKWILREAVRPLIPATILDRTKAGFPMPIDAWLRGPMRDFLHDHLQGTDSLTRAYYQDKQLKRILNEHSTGTINHGKLLWSLLNLEIWHKVYLKP